MTELSCIEITPSQPALGSIIWLHGLGADGNDFVPIVQELQLPASLSLRFVFPNAPIMPVTINNGYRMPAWFDIVSMSIDQRIDQVGIHRSVKLLENLIEKEIKLGIPAEKIVLAGFSQGAVIALTTGLQYAKKLGGVLALSGYLPFAEQLVHADITKINRATPIFIGHGTQDNVVPCALGQMGYELLNKHQYSVTWHSYSMPHSVCGSEIADIAKWLKAIFD